MPDMNKIPEYINCNYRCDIPFKSLGDWVESHRKDFKGNFQLDPPFQRPHVWTDDKRIKFVEYFLRNGQSSRDIYWNCAGWREGSIEKPLQLVDGKQRLDACLKFLNNEIPAFGSLLRDYTNTGRMNIDLTLKFHVNNLQTNAEVLQWYLDLNEGGVVHTKAELDKVKAMLAKEKK